MKRKTGPAATALLCLALAAASGHCAHLEIGDEARDLPEREPTPPRPIMPHNPVVELLRNVRIAPAREYGGMTVFPLELRDDRRSSGIRTLDEAMRNDALTIREQDSPRVGEVLVRNDSRGLVFLMAGEMISGGKQNRVIREDALLPQRSGFVSVPVYCVEQQRWNGVRDVFESPGTLIHGELRKEALAGASQDAIWSGVREKAAEWKADSETRDYGAIYAEPGAVRRVRDFADGFRRVPGGATVGAVIAVGDRIVSCDLFADPALFAALWSKICSAAALENPRFGERDSGPRRGRRPAIAFRDVRSLLDNAASARYKAVTTPGAGRALELRGAVTGSALTWDGEVVHAAFFPEADALPVKPDEGPVRSTPVRRENDSIWE